MKTTNTFLARFTLLGIGLACVTCQVGTAAMSIGRNTFQLQLHSTMSGSGANNGPKGRASSLYGQGSSMTNQTLQISCTGLATDQVYHLVASWGTNGELMHLSDFMPARSGAILMRFLAGTPHHFAGTNNPGQDWSVRGGWTNHMSLVIYPKDGENWCDSMHNSGGSPPPIDNMGGGPGMGGGTGMGGNGGMDDGWPAMTNW